MKKAFLFLSVFLFLIGMVHSQDSDTCEWGGTVRFKPLPAVLGLFSGIVSVTMDWVPYVTPNVGIPVELDFAAAGGVAGFGIYTGLEGAIGRKEKNGLFLAALAGPMFINGKVYFAAKSDIGYQLVTDRGFVFTPAVGFKFSNLTGFGLDYMLDIGFAYKKRH